jgi:dTDP-glucose 4,6-dehydratase
VRVLCTGSAGFLGSRLVPVLGQRGHIVWAVDRHDGDLRLPGQTRLLVEASEPDVVVHLAANPGRVFGEENATDTVATNTIATINVAKACADVGARLVYVSTSEVYGTACGGIGLGPVREDRPRGKPLNLYGATKMWGEDAAWLYAPENLTIIRPSMPYGPGMATGHGRAALPSMIASLLHRQSYTVHVGTKRSWCYVDDLVCGMADVIERGTGIYNVGRDDDLRSMYDVAMCVCDVTGAPRVLVKKSEPDDTITRVKDISMEKLRALGWRPDVDLVEGVKRTAASIAEEVTS